VRYGTGARASQLGRSDLAGKTGTTNDARDGWFAGYNPDLVAVAWIGFDQPRSLGRAETGAQAALPIWTGFMGGALKGVAQTGFAVPGGVTSATIDPLTGQILPEGQTGLTEYFYQENVPSESLPTDNGAPLGIDAPSSPSVPDKSGAGTPI
jgi:penicillin-binding protein 1A